jgi:hypothetical protein
MLGGAESKEQNSGVFKTSFSMLQTAVQASNNQLTDSSLGSRLFQQLTNS